MKSIKGIIKPSELAPFIKPADAMNALIIVFIYAFSFALIYLNQKIDHIAVTILFMIIMGGVHNTTATFIHEAAHGHVFSNKKVNDMLGHFFFAAPLVSYLEDYRYLHWEHHRHTGKVNKDPELAMYRAMGLKPSGHTKAEVVMIFAKSILGILSIKGLMYLNKFYMSNRKKGLIKQPGLFEHAAVVFWVVVVPLIMWKMGLLMSYLVIWLVPIFTTCTTLLLWHGFGEHIREKDSDLSQNTFTHKFDVITNLFIYPINSGYHLEHHLYPQLPWHAMVKFRKWAEQNPAYNALARDLEVDGYFVGKKTIVEMSFPVSESLSPVGSPSSSL